MYKVINRGDVLCTASGRNPGNIPALSQPASFILCSFGGRCTRNYTDTPQLPYNSDEHCMSSLFLIRSLWSQTPSATSGSKVVNVSAGANCQCSVVLCSAASCSTGPNIYCTRVAWQKHTAQQLGVIVSTPSVAILFFIAWSCLIVIALVCYSTGLCERAPSRQSQRAGDPWGSGDVINKIWSLRKADISPTVRNQLEGGGRMWLLVTSKPHVPSLQPWQFKKFVCLEVFCSKGLWAKEGGSEAKEWLLHYAASITTRELDFDLLAEVCNFYSGTWWSIPCQHLYNIKHLHPYGECIIKACCIQLWKLSHILPKLHCNPQMRAGSQNGKSLA